MGRKQLFSAEQVIDAVPGTAGFPVAIAKRLDCSAQTIRDYAKRYPTVAEAIKNERENTTDFVENALLQAIKDGNVTAMIFYLKTQAKDRGYVERQEVTGAAGGPMAMETRIIEVVKDYGTLRDD